MGFAENFIAAYHVGASQRRQKDQQALQQQEFEERKKEREQQLTLSQKMFDLHMADAKNAFAKEIIANRASTPTPVQELPSGQAGPPSPVQEAPVMMTDPSTGQQTRASAPHMEDLEAQKMDMFEKQKRLVDLLDKVKLSTDIPEIGAKAGVEYDPKELAIKQGVFAAKEKLAGVTRAAESRSNQLLTSRLTNLTPLTDEEGNFTGQLIDKMGGLHENAALSGLRGKPLTGQVASRVHQAAVVNSTGEMLLSHIDAVRDKLGPIMGRGFKLEKLIGNPDPDINRFGTELASFAALQPGLHGFRGQKALSEFEKIIGGAQTNPDALGASIQGIMDVGGIIEKSAQPKGAAGKEKTTDPNAEADAYLNAIGGK